MPKSKDLKSCDLQTLFIYLAQILHILSLFFFDITCHFCLNLPPLNCHQVSCPNLILFSMLDFFKKNFCVSLNRCQSNKMLEHKVIKDFL